VGALVVRYLRQPETAPGAERADLLHPSPMDRTRTQPLTLIVVARSALTVFCGCLYMEWADR